MRRNNFLSHYPVSPNLSLEHIVNNAFLKSELIKLTELLTNSEKAAKVETILSRLCYQTNLSSDKSIWNPLCTLFLEASKSDQHTKLLKVILGAIEDPYRYYYDTKDGDRTYAIDLAIQQNALMNFKLLAETAYRLGNININALEENYSNNDHVALTLRRLKAQLAAPNEQNILITPLSTLSFDEEDEQEQVYQDDNIPQQENKKRQEIKNQVKSSLNYTNRSAPTIDSYMPKWEEAFLYANEYKILFAATGQVFSVNNQEASRYCSGTHIGEGYFLTAGHCNESCLTEFCSALPSIRVTFDYQYNQNGEYEQTLSNLYHVQLFVYNGFVVETNESELANSEKYHDYLIFKLDNIPAQAVACTDEIPSQDEPVTMMHHPNGMLKKISFGKIVAVQESTYGEEKLKSDIEHNAHDWGGSSGAGLYWNSTHAICAVHVASYDLHSTCSNQYPGSAVSIQRIAADIESSPLFEKDKDMQNVHRLLASQGLFKNTNTNNTQTTSNLFNVPLSKHYQLR